MMHSLYPVAHHTAATSIEMYLKCALQIIGDETQIRHDLKKGFELLQIRLTEEISEFIETIQEAYEKKKYPDSWDDDPRWYEELKMLDTVIVQLRNVIHSKSKQNIGTQDLLLICVKNGGLIPNIHERHGVMSLRESFVRSNYSFGGFNYFS